MQEVNDLSASRRPIHPYRQRIQESVVVCWDGNLKERW